MAMCVGDDDHHHWFEQNGAKTDFTHRTNEAK